MASANYILRNNPIKEEVTNVSDIINVTHDGSNFEIYSDETLNCTICMEDYEMPFMFFIDECAHSFCISCIKNYCKDKITDAVMSIKCPDKTCDKFITYQEVKFLLADDDKNDQKYEGFLLRQILESLDDIVWCPAPNCENAIPIMGNEKEIKCNKCNYIFCAKCKEETHSGYTCEQYKKYGNKINTFETWLEIKGDTVKKCPTCNYYTEKTEGCNHMTCKKCKTDYCWLCTSVLTNVKIDFDGHYNVKRDCIKTYKETEEDRIQAEQAKHSYRYYNSDSDSDDDY